MLADGPVDEASLGPGLRLRWLLLCGSGVVLVAALVPPLLELAGRNALWEAVQYVLLAYLVPLLVVLAAPWSLAAARQPRADGTLDERAAFVRVRNRGELRAVLYVIPFLAAIVAWRVPGSVDALARHRWLVGVEAATLLVTGVLAWLELVASPPLRPRSHRPRRIVLAALPMWTTWILSFVLGFSRSEWFHAYHYQAGRGLSLIADQQLTAGVLWIVPFCIFVPYEFTNIVRWLRGSEDPDMELRTIVRRGGR